MLRAPLASLVFAAALAQTAHADEVTDTLNSAIKAYEEGDVQYALEELDYARQLMAAMKADALSGFLPEAPAGWTREVDDDIAAGLSLIGGVGAEADYSDGTDTFTITIMADNPMISAMSGVMGNATLMGAKIERVGRQKFMNQDGELSGLIDGRILVKADGADIDVMIPILEMIDYRELGRFGM